jgi:hypothetical protein
MNIPGFTGKSSLSLLPQSEYILNGNVYENNIFLYPAQLDSDFCADWCWRGCHICLEGPEGPIPETCLEIYFGCTRDCMRNCKL